MPIGGVNEIGLRELDARVSIEQGDDGRYGARVGYFEHSEPNSRGIEGSRLDDVEGKGRGDGLGGG